jgi:hypothetical protein
MVARPEVLAVIPARGGSKGIPRKNIRDFAGYPLIAYSIAAGLQSELVTRTIVSTDDEEIAQVARQWGAEVPFLRPDEIAQDQTLDLPVFQHALAWLAEHEDYHPDVVVQLRPTSPVRPRGCVDARCSSCWIILKPVLCAAWSQPGKIRIKCGEFTLTQDRWKRCCRCPALKNRITHPARHCRLFSGRPVILMPSALR